MEVEEQELEASKLAPIIPQGEKRQECTRFTPSGQVTIAKRPAIAPAVPEHKKKEVTKPEVKETPKGPNAGTKKPEVKKPGQQQPAKKPEGKKETWAQTAAAPPPPQKQPEQRQQQQQQSGQQQKMKGDCSLKGQDRKRRKR